MAPAGTPPEVVATLNTALRQVLAGGEAKATLTRFGLAPAGNTPPEFSRFIDGEILRWERVIQASGAKVD